MHRPLLSAAATILVACTVLPEEGDPGTPSDLARADAIALVRAGPHDWPERAAHVLGHPDAAAALVVALRAEPDGPGVPCAIAALGECGGVRARDFLVALLDEDDEVGTEAALALGRIGDREAVPSLRAAMADADRSAASRAAAAAALLDLAEDDAAVPFLAAVLLAGTPAGVEERERLGLPDKARWALERTIAIDAIARRTGGETFGLDPDLSWPDLERATTEMASKLRRMRP